MLGLEWETVRAASGGCNAADVVCFCSLEEFVLREVREG